MSEELKPHIGDEKLTRIVRKSGETIAGHQPLEDAFIEGFIAGRYGTQDSELALHWWRRDGEAFLPDLVGEEGEECAPLTPQGD